jgi:hypothetical protein
MNNDKTSHSHCESIKENSAETPPDEIDKLFDTVHENLRQTAKDEVEIFLPGNADPAKVRLLFDQVYRNLQPDKRSLFEKRKLITSDQRTVNSESLTEKMLKTAKIVRIKEQERKKRLEQSKEIRRQILADQQVIIKPNLIERLGACLIDTIIVTACTLTICLPFTLIAYSQAFFALMNGSPTSMQVALISAPIIGMLPIMTITYQAVWPIMKGYTLGELFSGLIIVDNEAKRPHHTRLLTRAMLMPLSILCFGFLTPIFGMPSLASLLSGTKTIVDYTSSESEEEEGDKK